MRKSYFARVLAIVTGALLCAGAAAQDYSGQTLRVAMWGGGWLDAQRSVVGQCFEERTGATVEYVPGNPLDNLAKLLAARSGGQAVPFDLIQTTENVQMQLIQEDLVERQSAEEIPSIAGLWDEADTADGYGRGFYYSFHGIAYNTEKFEELGLPAPTSIEDLFRPELAGHVAHPDLSHSQGPSGLVVMAMAAGGGIDDIVPGLELIRELDPIIYRDSSELESRFLNGEVWAAWWIDGRTWSLQDEGFPITHVRPEVGDKRGFASFGVVEIVKGTPNRELAEEWLACQYSGESGVQITRVDNYGAPSGEAAAVYAEDPVLRQRYALTAEDMASAMTLDWEYISSVWSTWQDLWNRHLLF